MTNYQLYHTNVYLGGQMKYDLVISPNGNDLVVSDFHISPISPLIPFNRHTKENLLNYPHQENIKKFYKQISSRFYDQCVDPVLESPYPIMTEYSGKLYDDTYEMGCQRASYKIYGRQFEFLCPLWIEKLTENEHLGFEIVVYMKGKTTPLFRKNIILKPVDGCTFHNNFVEYLNNYLDYIGVRGSNGKTYGSDSVFNINPFSNASAIEGFNVEMGLNQVKQLPHLLTNLFNRELPLIEFDNTITRSLQDNKLITKQLFNFNLCFNLEHIVSKYILDMLRGTQFVIEVNANVAKEVKTIENGKYVSRIHSQILEVCDIYSNYEYIPRKYCGEKAVNIYEDYTIKDVTDEWKIFKYGENHGSFVEPNVLDYMKDYKCIDYIDKNKITQPIIHWSLSDNKDYIFNVYNGFGGYHIIGEGKLLFADHKYDNTPNYQYNDYIPLQNTNCWCNSIILNSIQDEDSNVTYNVHYNHFENLKSYYSDFYTGSWNNGTKNMSDACNDKFKLLVVGCPATSAVFSNVINSQMMLTWDTYYSRYAEETGNSGVDPIIYHFVESDTHYVLFGITGDGGGGENDIIKTVNLINNFTLSDARELLEKFKNAIYNRYPVFKYLPDQSIDKDDIDNWWEGSWLKKLLNFMDIEAIDSGNMLTCPTSLTLKKVNNSSLSADEIYYEKSGQHGTYVERHFGKIKPTFITCGDIDRNRKYYKMSKYNMSTQEWEVVEKNINKYNKCLGEPIYPSVGYFFMEGVDEDYSIGSFDELGLQGFSPEVKKFNSNVILNVRSGFEWKLTQSPSQDASGNLVYGKIRDLIKDKLCEVYNIDEDDDLLEYVLSLYDYTISLDYKDSENVTEYTYDVKLTLK